MHEQHSSHRRDPQPAEAARRHRQPGRRRMQPGTELPRWLALADGAAADAAPQRAAARGRQQAHAAARRAGAGDSRRRRLGALVRLLGQRLLVQSAGGQPGPRIGPAGGLAVIRACTRGGRGGRGALGGAESGLTQRRDRAQAQRTPRRAPWRVGAAAGTGTSAGAEPTRRERQQRVGCGVPRGVGGVGAGGGAGRAAGVAPCPLPAHLQAPAGSRRRSAGPSPPGGRRRSGSRPRCRCPRRTCGTGGTCDERYAA